MKAVRLSGVYVGLHEWAEQHGIPPATARRAAVRRSNIVDNDGIPAAVKIAGAWLIRVEDISS